MPDLGWDHKPGIDLQTVGSVNEVKSQVLLGLADLTCGMTIYLWVVKSICVGGQSYL